MGRSTRHTLEEGIYQDASGFEVVARIGKRSKARRFPAGTGIRDLRAARKVQWNELDAEIKADPRRATTDRTSLSGAVEHYLTVSPCPTDSGLIGALRAWQARFPDLPRRKLTEGMCVEAFEEWKQAWSPQTLVYRKRALRKLWQALDGPTVKTPVDGIVVKKAAAEEPVWVPDGTIQKVYDSLVHQRTPLADADRSTTSISGRTYRYWTFASYRRRQQQRKPPDLKTPARFLVLATCGQRPVQLKRATPEDIEFYPEPVEGIHGIWWVPSAKGGNPVPCYLNQEQATAWRRFIAAEAWGEYDTRSFARTLRRNGWPAGVRPYNARHAVGITLSERGTDLADIQIQLGHQRLQTTRTFYVPKRHSRMKAVARTLDHRFDLPPLPATKRKKASA